MSYWLIRDDSPHDRWGLSLVPGFEAIIKRESLFGLTATGEGLFQAIPRPASYNWGGYIPRGGILDELDHERKIHLTNEP